MTGKFENIFHQKIYALYTCDDGRVKHNTSPPMAAKKENALVGMKKLWIGDNQTKNREMQSAEQLVLDLSTPDLRENALLELSKVCLLMRFRCRGFMILPFNRFRNQFDDADLDYAILQRRKTSKQETTNPTLANPILPVLAAEFDCDL
ncbi:hypothetical protein E3N88_15299 [Mikania micrantha]|uniref:Uncharacterized protein n=1 Tax=Mikania micrantha TaxID=192012 RepID=A0A5N6NV86_9ASTR|nr:hypothetical protein E3N88_15299 [Mikania micrantha]